ncbi:MAG: flagellar basal body-associated FliL family protein [Endozoicomonadaceae bacterium]|nr:flagellar basal body-associated FliL family protein [Endozoicomonadaceae bacterium]
MSEENAEKEQKGSGKSTNILLIILIVLLVLGLGGGGAAVFFMMQKGGAEEKPAEVVEPAPAKPIFYPLSPFVLSLTGDRRARYMQIELSIKIKSELSRDTLADYSPMIRHRFIEILSGLPYVDVIQPEAPDQIRERALKSLMDLFEEEGVKDSGVDDIMITNLVIQ